VTYLIDTDWVVDYLKGVTDAVSLIPVLQPDGIAISVFTFTEVYEGIYGGRDPIKSEQSFRAFLRVVPVIGVNRTIARETARIRLDLKARPVS
jgi:predicted nucleic acid-binding protein